MVPTGHFFICSHGYLSYISNFIEKSSPSSYWEVRYLLSGFVDGNSYNVNLANLVSPELLFIYL